MPNEHEERVQLFADDGELVWLPLVAERLFAAHVREGREARGWTQARLAEELTVRGIPMSQTAVAKLERSDDSARRTVRLGEAVAIATLFHQSLRAMTQTLAPAEAERRRVFEAQRRYQQAAAAIALAQHDLDVAEQRLRDAQGR